MVDKLDTFAERLKFLRKKAGLSLAAVGRQLNVSSQAVHKWEVGGNVDFQRQIGLAELFNVNPGWLMHGKPDEDGDQFPHYIFAGITPGGPPSIPNQPDEGVFVPLLEHDAVTNWIARSGRDDYHRGEWIACPGRHSDSTFALKVLDSSMESLGSKISYSMGDIIFVDPLVPLQSGLRAILTGHNMEDGQKVIFREVVLDSWRMHRRPLNKDWPEQQVPIPEYELPAGVVIGKWVQE